MCVDEQEITKIVRMCGSTPRHESQIQAISNVLHRVLEYFPVDKTDRTIQGSQIQRIHKNIERYCKQARDKLEECAPWSHNQSARPLATNLRRQNKLKRPTKPKKRKIEEYGQDTLKETNIEGDELLVEKYSPFGTDGEPLFRNDDDLASETDHHKVLDSEEGVLELARFKTNVELGTDPFQNEDTMSYEYTTLNTEPKQVLDPFRDEKEVSFESEAAHEVVNHDEDVLSLETDVQRLRDLSRNEDNTSFDTNVNDSGALHTDVEPVLDAFEDEGTVSFKASQKVIESEDDVEWMREKTLMTRQETVVAWLKCDSHHRQMKDFFVLQPTDFCLKE